jgi:hypothetical protein
LIASKQDELAELRRPLADEGSEEDLAERLDALEALDGGSAEPEEGASDDSAHLEESYAEDLDGSFHARAVPGPAPFIPSRRRRSWTVPLLAAGLLFAATAAFFAYTLLWDRFMGTATHDAAPVAVRPPQAPPGGPSTEASSTAVDPENETAENEALAGLAAVDSPTEEEATDAPIDPMSPPNGPSDVQDAHGTGVDTEAVARPSGDAPEPESRPEPGAETRPRISVVSLPPRHLRGASDGVRELAGKPIRRDEIIVALKNGNTFQGILKHSDTEHLVLRVWNGEITLDRSVLEGVLPPDSIEYLPVNAFPEGFVEFDNGNRMYGRILLASESRVIMDLAGARLVFPRPAVEIDYRELTMVRPHLD